MVNKKILTSFKDNLSKIKYRTSKEISSKWPPFEVVVNFRGLRAIILRRFDGLSNPGRGASGLRGVFLVSDIFSEIIILSLFSFKSFEKFQRENWNSNVCYLRNQGGTPLEIWRNFRFLARAPAAQPSAGRCKRQGAKKGKKGRWGRQALGQVELECIIQSYLLNSFYLEYGINRPKWMIFGFFVMKNILISLKI